MYVFSEDGIYRTSTRGSLKSLSDPEPVPKPAHEHHAFKKVAAFFHQFEHKSRDKTGSENGIDVSH